MKSPLPLATALIFTLSVWACEGTPSRPPTPPSEGAEAAARAPEALPVEPPPSEVPEAVEGANLAIKRLSVDGLDVEDMSCKLDKMPLMASALVLGQLARSKTALDACVDEPCKPRFAWASSKETISGIAVADAPSPEAAVCLAKAIESAKITLEVECVATFVLGGP